MSVPDQRPLETRRSLTLSRLITLTFYQPKKVGEEPKAERSMQM